MSAPDIAGLVGVAVIVAGILAMAISALSLLVPGKRQDFVSPADEDAATRGINRKEYEMAVMNRRARIAWIVKEIRDLRPLREEEATAIRRAVWPLPPGQSVVTGNGGLP